jgi:DNA-binding SARP family transcriptional activator/tetratricopeptide (TPR) repeat protein
LSQLRFEVLGPLRGWRRDAELNLGSVQQRVVLAVLLLRADRPLSRDQLIAAVWGEDPPAYAVNLVHKHVARLRRVLEPARVRHAPSQRLAWTDAGYRLTVAESELDLGQFDRAVSEARRARAAGERAAAAAGLREALDLWRGPVCAGLSSPLLDAERDIQEERRLGVVEERIELDLESGDHRDLVPELRGLLAEHPLRERLWRLLMIALHRTGQTGAALVAFQEARRRFIDELGLEPTEQLNHVHEQILGGDPAVSPPPAAPVEVAQGSTGTGTGLVTLAQLAGGPGKPAPSGLVAPLLGPDPAGPGAGRLVPTQLPYQVPNFTGRRAELRRLDALLGEDNAPAPVGVITGPPGVGKSALAVHWAHRVRHRFPDGQLHVNLLGFDPHHAALLPGEALRGMLDALGIPATMQPVAVPEQAALYRSLLTGRRVLILIDDARDADQVRPLLPGAPGCLVVVTSRHQMPGLVAAEGAWPVLLDVLGPDESRELMERRLGHERVAAEPAAVDEMVAGCAGLPLALSIAATRAALHPDFPLAAFARELRTARTSLDVFEQDDRATDVRAVFECSYRALTEPAAAMLRLLSLHPGPDIGPAAAASLAGAPLRDGTAALQTLARAHLITEATPARFRMHDLIRVYAGELARRTDPAARDAALSRMYDHYLRTAVAAEHLVNPYQEAGGDADPPAGVTAQPLRDVAEALAWFGDEHQVLLALVDQMVASGADLRAGHLARTLTVYLNRRGLWSDLIAIQRTALEATGRLGDRAGQAVAHRSIAMAYLQLRRTGEAEPHLRQALSLYRELDDPVGQARTGLNLAHVNERNGRYDAALTHARQALALFCAADDTIGQADALNAIGWYHAHLGRNGDALSYCNKALALHRVTGDRDGEAHTLHSLAFAYQRHGDEKAAIEAYRDAMTRWRDLGDRYFESEALVRIGDIQHRRGDRRAARMAWEQAAAVLDTFGHSDVELVRARLAALDPAVASAAQKVTE